MSRKVIWSLCFLLSVMCALVVAVAQETESDTTKIDTNHRGYLEYSS